MKVGIYARNLSDKYGGVKEYIQNMTISLAKENPENNLVIFHNCDKKQFKKIDNIKEIIIKSENRFICDWIKAPKIINKENCDILWFPHDTIPFRIRGKKIVTIHDLAYYMPKLGAYKFLEGNYMKFMIRSSCKRADKIIAISNSTKKDIISILKINPKKISVIYEGVSKDFKEVNEIEKNNVKKKYNLSNKFLLFTGGISPRKNIKKLVKSFQEIEDDNLDLVLTGGSFASWNCKEVLEEIKRNKKIHLLGRVSRKDLITLYNLAEAYVYPSLYEGFGLPILEAQACECPVIASNTSSLPEVGGNSVLYITPEKEDAITNAMIKLNKDKKLRENLIKKGHENIKRFSWKKAAKELLNIYGCGKNAKE